MTFICLPSKQYWFNFLVFQCLIIFLKTVVGRKKRVAIGEFVSTSRLLFCSLLHLSNAICLKGKQWNWERYNMTQGTQLYGYLLRCWNVSTFSSFKFYLCDYAVIIRYLCCLTGCCQSKLQHGNYLKIPKYVIFHYPE